MKRQAAVFICTPEIVRTWLLYPLWLYTPTAYPERILIDSRDYGRIINRVKREPTKATPYDVATWFRLGDFREHVDHSLDYRQYVRPGKIATAAHEIRLAIERRGWIPKNDLDFCKYMADSFNHWLVFGLEHKKRLLKGEKVYEAAITATQAEYDAIIGSGNFPFEPQLLLERHFAKLLSAIVVRDAAMKLYPNKRVLVFDTGEFEFAAKLLARHFGWDYSERFAISQQIDPRFEDNIREEIFKHLHLELPSPICDPAVDDFSAAAAELKHDLSRGKRLENISAEADEAFAAIQPRVNDCLRFIVPESRRIWTAATACGTLNLITAVLGLAPKAPAQASAGFFLVTLLWNFFRATQCRHLLKHSGRTVNLRVRVYVEQALTTEKEGWRLLLLRLSRMQWPRPRGMEEDEMRRQLMAPWVTNPVWYHEKDAGPG